MAIDSVNYLGFLACVAVLHALLPAKGRGALLLCASLGFYAASSVSYLILLLALSALNYASALFLSNSDDQPRRSRAYRITVAADLAVLILFKYAIHFLDSTLSRFGIGGRGMDGPLTLLFPLGLSYFTFEMVGAVTDAYRRTWVCPSGLGRFVLFGFFFPQISSGPIPRPGRLIPQFASSKATGEDIQTGLRLIAYGLFKKFVVANRLAGYVGVVFDDARPISTLPALIGCCFNALLLYADFSGYVDIAMGSARLFGIRLDPNFDHPFVSVSVTEFWRRWHMTFSFWLRDYLFLPLRIALRAPGNSGTVIALMATFVVCGVWHGATWPFLALGVAHGTAMSVELVTKPWRTRILGGVSKKWIACSGWVYTTSFIVFTQIFFTSANFVQVGHVYARLFGMALPRSVDEIFCYLGPANFAISLGAIGLWVALSRFVPKPDTRATAAVVIVCAVLIWRFGVFSPTSFIYTAF